MSENSPSRRRFLLLAGTGGLAAFAAAGLWKGGVLSGASAAPGVIPGAGLKTFTRTSWALGADISLCVLHAQQAVAEAALDAAFVELNTVEDIASIYRPHSQISRLN